MSPLLSILVATRNRIPYCINLIQTILSFDYEDFELIIQDNSDSLELKEFANTRIKDKRLIYNYTSPPFSSIDNFNKVIELSRGEYLCMIGDDDCVTHEIFTLVEWMKRNSIEAVKPNLVLMYRWPDACDILSNFNGDNGNLEIRSFTGKIGVYEVQKELDILLDCGCQNYLERNLPKLYHGIVAKNKIFSVKDNTGNFTGGLSPDIYWVIALSKLIREIYVIDYPVTIPGVCSVPLRPGEHMGKVENLEDAPHFRDRGKYEWSKVVPKFYCAENIWADSAYAALVDNKMILEQSKFNLRYLCTVLYDRYIDKRELIISHLSSNSIYFIDKRFPSIILFLFMLKIKLFKMLNSVVRKFREILFRNQNPMLEKAMFKNVTKISEANDLLSKTFKYNEVRIERILMTEI